MPVSSCFPSYPNTTLFLAAGNPSWADNTPLESDLKSFLSFFLMLEVRKPSTFSFSPGEGEIAAGPVGRGGGTFGCLHGPSAQVEHPGGWGRDSGMWLEPGKRRCRVPHVTHGSAMPNPPTDLSPALSAEALERGEGAKKILVG